MLLFLMVAVAVLTITMLGVARNFRRGIQRDREVEMIHRGEQYARAVRRYYHKFGSYPVSIEQLQSSNNLRFLRKKYKDPTSPDGEWKLVHPTDIKLKAGGGLTPAAGTVTGTATANPGDTGTNASSINQNTTSTNQNTKGSAFGANGTGSPSNAAQDTGGPEGGVGGTGGAGTNGNAANSVLGGGPLLGVVSKQTTEGIHSFGDKSKYSEWFFIYDPIQDKGQLLVGPYNPNMFVGTANSGLGTPNKSPSGSGQLATPDPGSSMTPSPTTPSSTPTPTLPSTTR